jgi:hypothetical protein
MQDALAFSGLFEFLVACKSYLPPENLPMNAKIRIIVNFAQGIVTLKQVHIRCSTFNVHSKFRHRFASKSHSF